LKKLVSKEAINTIFAMLFIYLYVHYIAPYVNSFFMNPFTSLGGILVFIGIWGNLARMVLLKSVFITNSYKKENCFFIIVGCLLLFLGIAM
jgi:uncharacterized membrane protein YqgA involved in biofilm formation